MKLTPSSPELSRLAKMAGVRPCHLWHLIAFQKEQRGKFRPEAFAHFNGLELRHVTAMLAVLAAETGGDQRSGSGEAKLLTARGSRLAEGFILSEPWRQFAQSLKFWTNDIIQTEFDKFCDYWHAQPGQKGVKLDWDATWRNWVRNSRQQAGERLPEKASPEAFKALCKRSIEFETRRGNFREVEKWRAKLAACN